MFLGLTVLTQVVVEPSQSLSEWVRIAQLVTAGTGVPRVDVLTQVGVEPSQSLSEWVRIAQLVTAGTGVPRVDGSNPGGGRAQPKFV